MLMHWRPGNPRKAKCRTPLDPASIPAKHNEVFVYQTYFKKTYVVAHRHIGFLTQDLFHFTSLATWGSSGASKEAKFFKELTFLGFVCYLSAKIEQSSTMSKTELKNAHLGFFFLSLLKFD